MASIIDDQIKPIIDKHGWIKVVLSVLFTALTYGKGKGLFNKGEAVK